MVKVQMPLDGLTPTESSTWSASPTPCPTPGTTSIAESWTIEIPKLKKLFSIMSINIGPVNPYVKTMLMNAIIMAIILVCVYVLTIYLKRLCTNVSRKLFG